MSARIRHRLRRRPDRPRRAAVVHLRRHALRGLCRRHAGLGAAGQRRAAGRALVQVSSPARHPDGGLRGAERAGRAAHRRAARAEHARHDGRALRRPDRARARTAGPRSPSTSARSTACSRRSCGAGFYYKTFMWPAAFWEKRLRAADPPRRRPRPRRRREPIRTTTRRPTRFCDVLVIGAGPAGLRRRWRPARAGARVILGDEDFRLGGRLLAERREIDGKPAARLGRAVEAELAALPERPHHAPHHGVRRLRRRHLRRGRAGHRSRRRRRPRTSRASASGRSSPSAPCSPPARSSGRSSFGGNDRPGVMLAGAVRTYLNRFAVAPGRRLAVFTNNDDGWRDRADLAAAGVDVAAVIDARREPTAADCARRKASASSCPARASSQRRAGRRCARSTCSRRRPHRYDRCDPLAVSGGWNPTCTSPAISAASRSGTRPWPPSCPARCRRGWPSPARPSARSTLADCLADGARGRRAAASSTRLRADGRCPAEADDESRRSRRSGTSRSRGQGLRRPAERRHRQRTRARGPRRLPLGRAPEALHHARHGDRSGQDRKRHRPGHPGRS